MASNLTAMSIVILGDTHLPKGSRRLPEACVEAIRASELVIHTGDFTRLTALEEIAALGTPMRAVHGNVDEPLIAERLPLAMTFEVGPVRIGLIHDAGASRGRLKRMQRSFPDADVVVFGHSHLPLHERGGDGFQIFNPGSPTERRRAPRHSYGVAEVGADGSLELRHVWLEANQR